MKKKKRIGVFARRPSTERIKALCARIEKIKSESLTTNQLVDTSLFSSAGQASARRHYSLTPHFITNENASRIFYIKSEILKWIQAGMPNMLVDEEGNVGMRRKKKRKTSICTPIKEPRHKTLTEPIYLRLPHWILDIMVKDKEVGKGIESRSQWLRDKIIESLVSAPNPQVDEALNRAYLILHEGLHGKEGKTKQVASYC